MFCLLFIQAKNNNFRSPRPRLAPAVRGLPASWAWLRACTVKQRQNIKYRCWKTFKVPVVWLQDERRGRGEGQFGCRCQPGEARSDDATENVSKILSRWRMRTVGAVKKKKEKRDLKWIKKHILIFFYIFLFHFRVFKMTKKVKNDPCFSSCRTGCGCLLPRCHGNRTLGRCAVLPSRC